MSALIQMCDQWLENMDNGMLNGVVFLDIRKAFDSIDHSFLLKKMNEQFGIHGAELKGYLENTDTGQRGHGQHVNPNCNPIPNPNPDYYFT